MPKGPPLNRPALRTAHGQTPGGSAPFPDLAPSRLHPADTLERLQAIADYDVLDTPAEPAFDSIVRLAAEICGTRMAAISFVCDDRQWFKATHGITARETPIEQSICAHTIGTPDIFTVPDAASHGVFRSNALVSGSFGLRFYAGIPIHSDKGVPLGALCVLDQTARAEGLSASQAFALGVLARQVEAQLELRRSITKLERQWARESQLRLAVEYSHHHDNLTGLPDRRRFRQELDRALAACHADRLYPALFVIDIDHLRATNNAHGHDAGDLLLIEVARRLQGVAGENGIIARIGGDEFGILVRQCRSQTAAAQIAEAILDAVHGPVCQDDHRINCDISVGYALATSQAGNFARLFWKADLALAQAKAAGGGCARGFNTTLARAHDQERAMIERTRAALADKTMVPHYQPKVNLETGRLIGFEALLRIETADGHVDLPASVAAAFEDRDLSVAITDRMLECIMSDILTTAYRGIDIGHVAINTTSFDFSCRNFARQLLSRLAANGIAPAMIEVEVTESVALGRGRDHVNHALMALAEAGVRISLDDFGTGHASLTNVKQLPISALKIDRGFTRGLGEVADDSIVQAMATLCTRMGLSIVAEGVETARQVEILRQFGVMYGQGLYFSPAIPSANLGEMMKISAAGCWAPANVGALGVPAVRKACRSKAGRDETYGDVGSKAVLLARQGSH